MTKHAPLQGGLVLLFAALALYHVREYWQGGDARVLSKLSLYMGLMLLLLGQVAGRYSLLYKLLMLTAVPILLASIGMTLYPYFSS